MLNFKEIIVTTDFSERSFRALPYAVGFAEKFSADLKVVYVHEPLPNMGDVAWTSADRLTTDRERFRKAQESLQRLIEEHIPASVGAEAVTLEGNAVVEIVKYVKAEDTDLIVMATHGLKGFSRALMGSTAEAVVRKAPCPVLTLKQPQANDTGEVKASNG